MEEITIQQEWNMLTAEDPIVYVGMRGRTANGLHAGLDHLLTSAKSLYPSHKLLLKVFIENTRMGNIFFQNPTYPFAETNWPAMTAWAEGLGVDYIIKNDMDAVYAKGTNMYHRQMFCTLPGATTQPYYQQHAHDLVARSNQIMQQDELDLYYDPYTTFLIQTCVMQALYDGLKYPIKVVGAAQHDLWLMTARNYISSVYGPPENVLVEPIKDENGVSITVHGTAKVSIGWKNRKDCLKLTPAWLNGKTYYEILLPTDKGKNYRFSEIK